MSKTICINSFHKNYEVVFDDDIYKLFKELINEERFLVIDSKIYTIYFKEYIDLGLINKQVFLIDAEEQNKSIEYTQYLIQGLVANGVKRSSKIVAIGGGITQDVVCFTASILFRGISWIFIPTTLLAQADSCIGGKSSINFKNVKNLIGTFYPPDKIYISLIFLNSLTVNDIKSGVGEIYHYYFYSSSHLIHDFHLKRDEIFSDRSLFFPFIYESLSIKKEVIEIDEFDRGERRKFNYGHTFGHAIEALTNYQINHGQAVSVGMDLANFLSYKLGMLSKENYLSMKAFLKVNFPDFQFSDFQIDAYCQLLQKDKKNINANLICILSRGVGKLEVYEMELNSTNRSLILEYFHTEFIKGI
ncbi:AroB-related putative sugar phosphate phospholyase (cyclizing) [Leptospira santarosai]|uniref:3-dehydroquinate synthase n=1 Tax=Leptospira santarosai str. ZUN179 TaxID=1049985 RepID=M6USI7_9LEPT|nr:AroB-related putative sugar phosphate phospholyase (cyclizing) [Leptospira santarosai]EMO24095.1 3-dehydroquinate synthase [Leptospira santarosai str. HAI134]EMO45736.1 3-dehydroquinate synthase [Leptospira santarosai str. ZUN179]MDI7182262.1 3-dehydroquinate synthase [Leptospira santarosai]MDI7217540.1 3-dehydroquinate synthase [Leptospira santarosai]